jgi:antitoxin VapB
VNLLIDPLGSFDLIEREEANECLLRWEHKHGPNNRPQFRAPIDFGLRRRGELLAVATADTLIRPTCDFTRAEAFELSRLCAAAPRLTRLMLRLWTELGYPEIVRAWGSPWAISYQDAIKHTGNLYRFDGWLRLRYTTGGSDPRALGTTVSARKRWIWGWHSSEAQREERKSYEAEREKRLAAEQQRDAA